MRRGLLALLLLAGAGCTGYLRDTSAARGALARGEAEEAARALEAYSPGGVDRALWLRDRGMALHAAGRYAESFALLAEAEEVEAQWERRSLSEEAASLAADRRVRAARAFGVERGLATLLQLLNCAALGRDEEAQVEARRLMLLQRTHRAPPHAAFFAVSSAAWEAGGEPDAARVDGEAAGALAPGLLRWAFPRRTPLPDGQGELLLVLEVGLAPALRGRAGGLEVEPRAPQPLVRVAWAGGEGEAVRLMDVGQVLGAELESRRGESLALEAAGLGVKAGVAGLVGTLTHRPALGWATWRLLSGRSQADTRSWRTLPAEVQLLRLVLPAGEQDLRVQLGGVVRSVRVRVEPGALRLAPVWVQPAGAGAGAVRGLSR